jgi:FtsZ-binding cell division protein ZapB
MDEVDRTLEALKVHIKKEIVDNYFADRVYLEEEQELLRQETQDYRQAREQLAPRYLALYEALGSEEARAAVMEALSLEAWPFYQEFRALAPALRRELLQGRRSWGLTARSRFRRLIFDLYVELQRENQKLKEQYDKVVTHLKLLNEDCEKFNLSYDFGLIAAQMEALEGGGEPISGAGLLAPEREELSTRMRFKRQRLTDEDLPPLPELPPLKDLRSRLTEALDRTYQQ